jgi:hypothetical protein
MGNHVEITRAQRMANRKLRSLLGLLRKRSA